jgi:hypothetical protein
VVTLLNFQNETIDELTGAYPGFQSIGSNGAHYTYTKEDRLYIANFDLFGVPFDTYSASGNFSFQHTECALWFCVEAYNTKIIAGTQYQFTTPNTTVSELNISQADPTVAYYKFPSSPQDYHNVTNITVDSISLDVLYMWTNDTINGVVGLNEEAQAFSSDLMKGVWNGSTDPDTWISNIATSLTNVVRRTNPSSRSDFDGVAFEPGVSVSWEWIALPAMLVFTSILFVSVKPCNCQTGGMC